MQKTVTCKTAPNIAIVKYWGKRDRLLNLPINSSLSLTLSYDDLSTITTVSMSSTYNEDILIFNGKKMLLESDSKIEGIVTLFRNRLREQAVINGDDEQGLYIKKANCFVHIETVNSFPTAAGMASSASGLACLTTCLSRLYDLFSSSEDRNVLSALTRQASGSACRSLFGGLVHWEKGILADGSDSIAKQIFNESYWPELSICICVTQHCAKSVGSTEGMNQCVETSPLMMERSTELIPQRISEAILAFQQHNFERLGQIIMIESDTLHSICHNAKPPINYLSEQSQYIIQLVNQINAYFGHVIIAYSFDAGSNPFLFYERSNETMLFSIIFNLTQPTEVKGRKIDWQQNDDSRSFLKEWRNTPIQISSLFLTSIGNDPFIQE